MNTDFTHPESDSVFTMLLHLILPVKLLWINAKYLIQTPTKRIKRSDKKHRSNKMVTLAYVKQDITV